MPIQLPASRPSKLCTLSYKCGHTRYFQIEEVTSELTALQDPFCGKVEERIEEWVSRLPGDDSGDGTGELDKNGSDPLDEDLECLVADKSKEEGQGWWDILDLDGLFQTDGEADGETSDGWEMLGEILEPLELV
ncbi:MAG: hypothetical protein Q9209_006252 [Squamulea sp. 1 TL-2023]